MSQTSLRLKSSSLSQRTGSRSTKIEQIGYLLIILAVAFGFLTRLFAVFQYVTFDIGPDPDQIRDAFAVMNMWKGDLPTLGPQVSTIGRHHILPLYYYLFLPFTLLGADPVFLALPNALFSFLSIPLFMGLVYQLLENVKSSLRIFLTGLAGCWYSSLFGEIFISNFQWNPSSIPFFLMVFTLLYKLQVTENFSFAVQVALWATYGVVFAILISLHSSTLFVMPVVFCVTSALFIYQVVHKRRQSLAVLPLVSVLSAAIALLPYWVGELGRGFRNTKAILKTIAASGSSSDSFFLLAWVQKLSNLFLNYFKLAQQAYFWDASWVYLLISIAFLSVVTYISILHFKGNKYIWIMWGSTWFLYLLAAANLDSTENVLHYKLLILFAPIVFTITALAYSNFSKLRKRIFFACISVVVALSLFQNVAHSYQFMLSKYGPDRLLSTADVAAILNQLPTDATICDPRIKRKREVNNKYNYIDTYVTQRNIKVADTCQAGHYVIHPKRVLLIESNYLNDAKYEAPYFVKNVSPAPVNLFPVFKVAENTAIERPSELFLETDTAYVYSLKE